MLTSRRFVAQVLRLRWDLRVLCQSRLLHGSRNGASFKRPNVSQPPPLEKPSLLEELFPEEVRKDGDRDTKVDDNVQNVPGSGNGASFKRLNVSQPPAFEKLSLLKELFPEEVRKGGHRDTNVQNVPRLRLPEVDERSERFDYRSGREAMQIRRVTSGAAANAFRQEQVAVLLLATGSKSLVESDFRRIAPKGRHIDWTGLGDILKIIPVRDHTTLEPAGRYFILFAKPADARIYQNHIIRLHRIAKTHTPTSVESPLPLQPGVDIDGQDAHTMQQDYSLCPPSQRIQLMLLFPSYSPATKQVLDERGYRPLTGEMNKTGRSVLFSVDVQQLLTSEVKKTIAVDGRDRGLAWDISIDRLDTSKATADAFDGSTGAELDEFSELGARRHVSPRWVVSFSNESEARRFIRAWHRRPWPSTRGDDPPLVEAEFIW